ncbi:hypothetical protein ABZ575_15105, partial [Streptomyces sp. NPDC018347]
MRAPQIRISWPAGDITATLDAHSDAHAPTVRVLAEALHLASTARTRGEEVYSGTGVSVSRET